MRSEADVRIGGFQIAFLVFAVIFLAYPLQKYIGPLLGLEGKGPLVSRIFIFVPLALLLALVPQFRRFCIEQLRTPIADGRGGEVALVTATKALLVPLAVGGAIVLWHWGLGGEMALARRLGQQRSPEAELAWALTVGGWIFSFIVAGAIGPIIEELLFRGLLFRAWEARWGWVSSMLATSALFAAYHPVPFSAFVSAIIFVALYRRTGSLWSSIVAHGVGNMLLSPLLFGRFFFQTVGKETGEIGLWPVHLAALALLLVAVPLYVWMARDARLPEPEEPATEIRCA